MSNLSHLFPSQTHSSWRFYSLERLKTPFRSGSVFPEGYNIWDIYCALTHGAGLPPADSSRLILRGSQQCALQSLFTKQKKNSFQFRLSILPDGHNTITQISFTLNCTFGCSTHSCSRLVSESIYKIQTCKPATTKSSWKGQNKRAGDFKKPCFILEISLYDRCAKQHPVLQVSSDLPCLFLFSNKLVFWFYDMVRICW